MTATAAEIAKQIEETTWFLQVWIPSELKRTTHARRKASLLRQQAEAERKLSQLVTELGSTVQDELRDR